MNCKTCIHCEVCHRHEMFYDIEEHVEKYGCDDFKNVSDVLVSRIPIGTVVFRLVKCSSRSTVVIDGVEYYREIPKWHIDTFEYDWVTAVVDAQIENIEKRYFFDKEQAKAECDRRNKEEKNK